MLSNSSGLTNSSPPVNNNHHPSADSSSSGVVVKTKLSSEATNTGTVMNMEWTSLVDTATKAITNNDEEDDGPGANTATAVLNDESNSSSHAAAASAPEQKHTRNINVNGADNETVALRDRVAALEEQLRTERQGRLELETQIEHLKEENVRLKEESQTAAQQLRRFTEWFFQTIDKS